MYRYFRYIGAKNLDLIACTPARQRRFSRKRSWEASKETRARTYGFGVFATSFVLGFRVQASLKSSVFAGLHYYFDQINSLRNGRDYDLKQIENAFRDPEDGFWGKNSSESSEVY